MCRCFVEFKPFLLLIKIVLTSFLIPQTKQNKKSHNEILRTQKSHLESLNE